MKNTFGTLRTTLSVVLVAGLATQIPSHAATTNGWKAMDGNFYWYEDGVKQGTEGRGKEIYDPGSDAWYWLDAAEGGRMARDKDVYQESPADAAGSIGKWVRYDSEGHMVKGWDTTQAGTFYFDPAYGTMAKGSSYIDGVTYYFNVNTGILESCSISTEPHWETIDGKQYWYEGGIRQGYNPADASYRGKEIYDPGSDAWYWLDNIQQGAKAVNKDVYQESQADAAGTIGKWVRYDSEGHMVKGWDTTDNGNFYFHPIYGTMAKGAVIIGSTAYRFNEGNGVCEGEDMPSITAGTNGDDTGGESATDWNNILTLPTNEEIAAFNRTSKKRAPHLVGGFDIEPEAAYTEYSIDFKADYLPYGTYFCCAEIKMDLSSIMQKFDTVYMDGWLSFYAGLQRRKPNETTASIMSFWDIYCQDNSGKESTIRAKLIYPEDINANVFIHEGNGVNYLRDYPWEKGCWYRMLLRCRQLEENGHTAVEQWICNLENKEWTKLCCYDTGLTESCFVGNIAVFLENYIEEYAGDIRTAEYKNMQILPKGSKEWISVNNIAMGTANNAPGSYSYGTDANGQSWMITTGLENRTVQ